MDSWGQGSLWRKGQLSISLFCRAPPKPNGISHAEPEFLPVPPEKGAMLAEGQRRGACSMLALFSLKVQLITSLTQLAGEKHSLHGFALRICILQSPSTLDLSRSSLSTGSRPSWRVAWISGTKEQHAQGGLQSSLSQDQAGAWQAPTTSLAGWAAGTRPGRVTFLSAPAEPAARLQEGGDNRNRWMKGAPRLPPPPRCWLLIT